MSTKASTARTSTAPSTGASANRAAPKSPSGSASILEWMPSPLVLGGLALAGVVLIVFVHEFRFSPSVLFLIMGWLAIIGAGVLLWRVGLLVAAGDEGDDGSFDYISSRRDELVAEKASLLKAIKEVDFDRMMGKLSVRDAGEITDVYRRRAILILKELDEVGAADEGDGRKLTAAERIELDLRARAALAKAGKGTEKRVEAAREKRAKARVAVGTDPVASDEDAAEPEPEPEPEPAPVAARQEEEE